MLEVQRLRSAGAQRRPDAIISAELEIGKCVSVSRAHEARSVAGSRILPERRHWLGDAG